MRALHSRLLCDVAHKPRTRMTPKHSLLRPRTLALVASGFGTSGVFSSKDCARCRNCYSNPKSHVQNRTHRSELWHLDSVPVQSVQSQPIPKMVDVKTWRAPGRSRARPSVHLCPAQRANGTRARQTCRHCVWLQVSTLPKHTHTPGCRTDVRHAASAMLIAAGRTGLVCQRRMHTFDGSTSSWRGLFARNNSRSQVPGTARMTVPTAAAPQSAPRPYLTHSRT
jgi:hypothetical protein